MSPTNNGNGNGGREHPPVEQPRAAVPQFVMPHLVSWPIFLPSTTLLYPLTLTSWGPDEPRLVGCSTAVLPVLPEPLRLRHGPLPVTIEHWSDGTVVAALPAARLRAHGDTASAALDALADDIASTVEDLTTGMNAKSRLGGAMLDSWRALSVLVEAPELDGRSRE